MSRVLATTAGRSAGADAADLGGAQLGDGPDGDGPDGSIVRRLSRNIRWVVVAGVLTICLSLSATYVALREAPQRIPDRNASGQVRLSSDPQVRWQRPLNDVAAALGCPTALPSSSSPEDPGGLFATDLCSVTSSAIVGDVVVVAVQRSQRAELVGLVRETGSVRWHRAAPAGSTYDCLVITGRLWCLTVPVFYQVVDNTSPIDGDQSSFSSHSERSAAYRGATISRVDVATGAILHNSQVAGAPEGAAFAGVGTGGFYVLGHGLPDEATVARYSMGGQAQWSHRVSLVRLQSSFSFVTGQVAHPHVVELRGRALVSLAQVAGRQAVFSVAGGAPVSAGAGHVVTVLDRTVVTQVGDGVLTVGTRRIPENATAVLSADDRTRGEPLLVTVFSFPDPSGQDGSVSTAYVGRSPSDPAAAPRRLSPGDQPIAICGGVIVTLGSAVLAGYDAATGVRRWVADGAAGNDVQARCTDSQVVLANGYRISGYSLRSGASAWSLSIPVNSSIGDSGLGDPSDGMVVGLSGELSLPGDRGGLSYLR
ncbi:hypothetical protein V3G39_05745 [Dermatophilaceae bacterium Sec6.4]